MKSDAWYPRRGSAPGGERSFAAAHRGDGAAPKSGNCSCVPPAFEVVLSAVSGQQPRRAFNFGVAETTHVPRLAGAEGLILILFPCWAPAINKS
jgi:hypothetical protein